MRKIEHTRSVALDNPAILPRGAEFLDKGAEDAADEPLVSPVSAALLGV
jgi:hypothetical protein